MESFLAIPFLAYFGPGGGERDLASGLLYATKGGRGNTSVRYGSAVMVLQCFLMMLGIEGSLGSNSMANTGLLVVLLFMAFSNDFSQMILPISPLQKV